MPVKISAAIRQRAARIKLLRSGVSAKRRKFSARPVSGGLPTRRHGSNTIPLAEMKKVLGELEKIFEAVK